MINGVGKRSTARLNRADDILLWNAKISIVKQLHAKNGTMKWRSQLMRQRTQSVGLGLVCSQSLEPEGFSRGKHTKGSEITEVEINSEAAFDVERVYKSASGPSLLTQIPDRNKGYAARSRERFAENICFSSLDPESVFLFAVGIARGVGCILSVMQSAVVGFVR
ncbi:hypothetical protein HG531_007264 [Fusarium graminearum]|nr:hypothetical protein HG531_007264 [Fusarium graminearum]